MNVVDDWFRSAKRKKMEGLLLDNGSNLYKYLRPTAVQEMLKQHQTGNDDHHKILFSLVVFEEWLRAQDFARV